MSESKIGRDRLAGNCFEHFNCAICKYIVSKPMECKDCGIMYCKLCLQIYAQTSKLCVGGCPISSVTQITKSVLRVYNQIQVRCAYFDRCRRTLSLRDLEGHENNCCNTKCKNYDICRGEVAEKKLFKQKYCSRECFLAEFISQQMNIKAIYEKLQNVFKMAVVKAECFRWNKKTTSKFIETTDNVASIKGAVPSTFCTAITEEGFTFGKHYWQITMDKLNINELKAGVTTSLVFDYDHAFSDFSFGFAFYGVGQLRNQSDSGGPSYGRRWIKNQTLGVFLDMDQGTLSFSINGTPFGVAFKNESLKKGPVYPAVAMLGLGGFTINSKPIPIVFQK